MAWLLPVLCAVVLPATGAAAQVVDTVIASDHTPVDDLLCVALPPRSAAVAHPAPDRAPRPTDTVYYLRPPYRRGAIDTTIVLAVERRDWRRDSYHGGIVISTHNLSRRSFRYSACAGASVHLGAATVALRGVHGTIRLRGDLGALEGAAGRLRPARLDRRSTEAPPPAVPPRR